MAGRTEKKDAGKRRMDLVPWPAVESVADVMTFGANKYVDRGYYGMELMRLFAAGQRHALAWVRGEDTDVETGLPHLSHLAANALMMQELQAGGLGIDDRPEYYLSQTVASRPSMT